MRPAAIIDRDRLRAIAGDPAWREAFGPFTDAPFLTVETDAIDVETAMWLRSLPCPVIGVGAGSSAQAASCDLLIADGGTSERLERTIAATPLAAMVLVQKLRASEALSIVDALVAESLAFATLQQGAEFRAWRNASPLLAPLPAVEQPVRIDVTEEQMHITLAAPGQRNAIGTAMRDALCMAFDLAQTLALPVEIRAEGRCFSTGGAVQEFGQANDPATAHWVRSVRLPAARLAPIAARTKAIVQGATIGAGIEIAAFAAQLVARPDAWFQLPELAYGLIPGAGGTVSLPRRIGRHRTAWMALSMQRVPARQALAWGLIDLIEP